MYGAQDLHHRPARSRGRRALARARKDGHDASKLIRRGLRIVASRYYDGRRPPTTGLFVSTDNKLGDEAELFGDLEK